MWPLGLPMLTALPLALQTDFLTMPLVAFQALRQAAFPVAWQVFRVLVPGRGVPWLEALQPQLTVLREPSQNPLRSPQRQSPPAAPPSTPLPSTPYSARPPMNFRPGSECLAAFGVGLFFSPWSQSLFMYVRMENFYALRALRYDRLLSRFFLSAHYPFLYSSQRRTEVCPDLDDSAAVGLPRKSVALVVNLPEGFFR